MIAKILRMFHKKPVLLFVMLVLVWQFSFPHYASAEVITAKQGQKLAYEVLEDSINYRLPQAADKPRPAAQKIIKITVTAYSSTVDQTDGDPFTTASGTKVRDGVIATNFLPMGTKVRFPEKYGDKIFVVEDRMHPRHQYMADIWMPSRQMAKEWGVKYIKMEII